MVAAVDAALKEYDLSESEQDYALFATSVSKAYPAINALLGYLIEHKIRSDTNFSNVVKTFHELMVGCAPPSAHFEWYKDMLYAAEHYVKG